MADEPPTSQRPSLPPQTPQLSALELALQQRMVAVRIVRMSFFVLIATVTLVYILGRSAGEQGQSDTPWLRWQFPSLVAFFVSLGLLLLDLFTPRKRLGVITAIFFGALAGVLATMLLSLIIDLFVQTYMGSPKDIAVISGLVTAIKVIIGIGLAYLGITTVLQTQDDFRLVIPYVEFAKQLRGPRPLLLDSSALIDARIVDLASTGMVQVPLVVPRFVVLELQTLADSNDKMNRTRGKRGLDAVTRLQRTPGVDITIDDSPLPGKSVDQMLVELARVMPAMIVTTDANLNRVATIQNVPVLNLNDVANALKPSLIPGSQLNIHIVREGEQPGQGLGFLDDGTMVVVEDGAVGMGRELRAEVTSAMQTSAGRLIFARSMEAPSAPGELDDGDAPMEMGATPDGGEEPAPPMGDPLTIKPPTKPHKPGPFGPGQFGKSPSRNPRR